MTGDLSSPTPEKGGNNQSATNNPSDKGDSKPKNKIKPCRGSVRRKIFGFSETKFREFVSYFILIPWLWYDLIDSHGEIIKLCFLAVGLTVAHGLACSYFKSWKKAITVWLIAEIAVAAVVYENSLPELKPPLKLILMTPADPDFELPLTNDFLYCTIFSGTFLSTDARGCIVIPILPNQTNVAAEFVIGNDSNETYEDVDVQFIFPPQLDWSASPSPEWRTIRHWNNDARTGIAFKFPYAIQSFESPILPDITFADSEGKAQFVTVFIKAKDMKTINLVFWATFSHLPPDRKHPFIILGSLNNKSGNDKLNFTLPPN